MEKNIQYNDKQLEALKYDKGALLILAGAGSGKTRVLTGKIARLLEDKGIPDMDILAFTFTNKAAEEMKERIARILNRDIGHMWIGTFHSICSRILRMNIDKLGYRSDFTIYDSQDQKTLLKDILKSLDLDPANYNLNQILSTISSKKNLTISPSQMMDDAIYMQEKELAQIYDLYEKRKRKNNALDFDDLIVKTLELLEKDEGVLSYYQNRFKYVFVDEYQDTNHSQYLLIKLLGGLYKNICLVGDSDQSIYGWRGADISNILNFEEDYPEAKTILLEQNYRSKGKILKCANKLIENNTKRIKKNLWTKASDGEDVVFKSLPGERQEAEAVLEWIHHMKYKGYSYDQMAILYRINAQSRNFEEVFVREGVSYKVVGGLKFYDRKEIKDMIAYLNLLVNYKDDLSLKRVINTPKRGIGNTTLDKLSEYATKNNISIYEALDGDHGISKSTSVKLKKFKDMIEAFKSEIGKLSVSDLAMEVYEESGMKDDLEKSSFIEDKSRIENISSFFNSIKEYEEREEGGDLRLYLQNIALMSDVDKTEEKKSAISLMTMHAAKGLEFPLVFIVGLEDGLFPSRRAIEEGGLEEERRLFYVAITRAKERLFLTSAETRRLYGNMQATSQSRFLREIDDVIVKEEDRTSNSRQDSLISNRAFDFSFEDREKSREKYRNMILEKKKRIEENSNKKFKSGDKVKHKKFGIGTIVMVMENPNGDELTVAFEKKGIKKLNAKIAPLEAIDGR